MVRDLIEVMSQPRATPALHIRVPRKPFPPAITTFFLTVEVMICKVLRTDFVLPVELGGERSENERSKEVQIEAGHQRRFTTRIREAFRDHDINRSKSAPRFIRPHFTSKRSFPSSQR